MTNRCAPPDKTRGFATYAVEFAVGRLYRKYLREIDITFPQFLIITTLADGRPRSVKAIATMLGLSSSTVTPILNRLKDSGLIVRGRARAGDGRASLVSLAPNAIALANQLIVIQANVDLDFGLVSEELNRLRKTLLALAKRLHRRNSPSSSSDHDSSS